tara:strand:- start:1795 stop:2901 length:1107 start_codon:yes stop_codon:yes gene_type:complete
MKIRKFLQKCFKKFFQSLFKIIYGNIKLNSNLNTVKLLEKKKILNIRSDIEGVKDYYTYKIQNGRVYTDYVNHVAIISKNDLIDKISYQQIHGELKDASNNVVLIKGTPAIKRKIQGSVLSLVQGASGNNYGHWLLEMLPKIKLCSENFAIEKINYFYTPNLNNFHKETLSILNIKNNQIIDSEKYRHIQADELLIVDHPSYYKGYIKDQFKFQPSWVINWLKDTFLPHAKKFNANKKVFIDRTDSLSKHCQFLNEKEVNNYLSKKGFVKYQLTKLTFLETVYLFHNAEVIVGAHGAALVNLIFCLPKTKVIEIKPITHTQTVFERLSSINNLDYRLIKTKEVDNDKKDKGDIDLSIDELENCFKSFI